MLVRFGTSPGIVTGRKGRQYKKFDVFVWEKDTDDDGEGDEPSRDERVPF